MARTPENTRRTLIPEPRPVLESPVEVYSGEARLVDLWEVTVDRRDNQVSTPEHYLEFARTAPVSRRTESKHSKNRSCLTVKVLVDCGRRGNRAKPLAELLLVSFE